MATNQTGHYELNQWLSTDQVLRTDFNTDNAKIDAALAGLAEDLETETAALAAAAPKFASGSYTGNGVSSRTISLAFTPKAVFLCTLEGITYTPVRSGYVYGGLAVTGCPVKLKHGVIDSPQYSTAVEVAANGFKVYETPIDDYCAVCCNTSGLEYHYIAVG